MTNLLSELNGYKYTVVLALASALLGFARIVNAYKKASESFSFFIGVMPLEK